MVHVVQAWSMQISFAWATLSLVFKGVSQGGPSGPCKSLFHMKILNFTKTKLQKESETPFCLDHLDHRRRRCGCRGRKKAAPPVNNGDLNDVHLTVRLLPVSLAGVGAAANEEIVISARLSVAGQRAGVLVNRM